MIEMPHLFAEILKKSPELEANVKKSFEQFDPWLEQSGMPFFPGFTDHSPRHITDVLTTAASLISDSGREQLSPEDVAVLCMAILLHDCGMHLTQDSFRALVGENATPPILGMGDLPWKKIWNDFLAEAHRFGQEKLIAIFGDPQPIDVSALNLENLNERDCLLIGEFVRRHHTRLAHEISLKGVAVKNSPPLELSGFDVELKDIAGLVARSHGMSIRDTFDYIENKYSIVAIYRNIKIPYLMAILRIADYIQVKSERAIRSLLSVKELKSPVSRQEWLNHFAVRDVSPYHEDPEAYYVHAAPTDIKTYLKLVALFKDIQRELDESWATIGEVYGRLGKLASLGLTIRRIRSNLDSPEKFSKTVNYIPIKAGFDSSGPDLLKLLVGPLYDYNYAIGIRELVQNAVDACREAKDLCSKNGIHTSADDYVVSVDICELEGGGTITIVDNGVGMTLETVTKFFLIAGASFRNSDIWKRQHTSEEGESRVVRGGRFGVGALAAFLLGEEIEVTTRHMDMDEAEGIHFTARMDEPAIELKNCQAPAGTTIKINVKDPAVFDKIRPGPGKRTLSKIRIIEEWAKVDWFIQNEPIVSFNWSGFNYSKSINDSGRFSFAGKFKSHVDDLVPEMGDAANGWQNLINPSPYRAILWRYIGERKKRSGDSEFMYQPNDFISVNGIRVQEVSKYGSVSIVSLPQKENELSMPYFIDRPSIAIFDPAGICPINLQRSSVAFDRMQLDSRLAYSILTKNLTMIKDMRLPLNSIFEFYRYCREFMAMPGIYFEGQLSPVFLTKNGVFPTARKTLSQQRIQKLFFVDIRDDENLPTDGIFLREKEALLFRVPFDSSSTQSNLSWFRAIFSPGTTENYSRSRQEGFPLIERGASMSLMKAGKWKNITAKGRVARYILDNLRTEDLSDGYVCVKDASLSSSEELCGRALELLQVLSMKSGNEVSAWDILPMEDEPEEKGVFLRVWDEVFGQTEEGIESE